MAGAVFKLLAVDTFVVQLDPFSFVPFLNPHFLTLSLVAVLLSGLAYWGLRKGTATGMYEPLDLPRVGGCRQRGGGVGGEL